MQRLNVFILFIFIFLSGNISAENYQAPEINLPGIDGNVQLKNYKGKVVYLDFWASWCLPCKKSFPWMTEIKKVFANQGFEIIAINLDKDKKLAERFLKVMDINFEIAFDDSRQSAEEYKLHGLPSSFLIGRDGKVYASHEGFREQDKAKLEQAISVLLKK